MYLQNFNIEVFLKEYWQKKPLLIRQGLPHFQSPISADELAGLALEEDIESRLVLEYPHQNPSWKLERGPFHEKRLTHLPPSHWSLLIQGVDRLVDEVAELVDIFSFIPNWRFDDVMISLAGDQGGVGPHYDLYDVFLVQAEGTRRWSLTTQDCHEQNRLMDVPLRLMEHFDTEEEFIVEPGDVLYIPPSVGHWGVALDPLCMTYSFGYRSYQAPEMLHRFADFLAENATPSYYQDPSWLGVQKGYIPQSAFIKARELCQLMLNNDSLLTRWFGCFATSPDLQVERLLSEFEQPQIEKGQWVIELKKSDFFCRDRLIRMAMIEDQGILRCFMNGEESPIQDVDRALVELIVNHFEVSVDLLETYLNSEFNQAWLRELWSTGYWHIE